MMIQYLMLRRIKTKINRREKMNYYLIYLIINFNNKNYIKKNKKKIKKKKKKKKKKKNKNKNKK